jgi:hypothetical protein
MLQYINNKKGVHKGTLQLTSTEITYIRSKLFNYQDRTLNTCNKLKTKQNKWTFSQLVCLPYPHLLPRFSLVSGGHHGFFQTIGFRQLTMFDVWTGLNVNVKKGKNFYESILNVLIPKGIRFLLKLDNKAF